MQKATVGKGDEGGEREEGKHDAGDGKARPTNALRLVCSFLPFYPSRFFFCLFFFLLLVSLPSCPWDFFCSFVHLFVCGWNVRAAVEVLRARRC